MTSRSPVTIRAVSGLGSKGPACFLVEGGGRRLLLDLGYGPQPGLLPEVDDVGAVDALIISHSHKDHAGGLSLLPKIGNPPIYATEMVARRVPGKVATRPLPIRGVADVMGVSVETGRNGHAPGGIWMRFAIGDGVLYTGDYSTESILYAYDPPPKAHIVILNSSYGADDAAMAERQQALTPILAGDVLLPVPEDGRGPEIALHAARNGRTTHLDDAMRAALRQLAGVDAACLRDELAGEIGRLANDAQPIAGADDVMLAAPAAGTSGETARLLTQWESQPTPAIVFTGYVPPDTPAARLVKSGRAQFMRWNVHPRLSDNVALVRATGADTVMPAFCDRNHLAALTAAFAPAKVTMDAMISS